jgi:hypothetical protein
LVKKRKREIKQSRNCRKTKVKLSFQKDKKIKKRTDKRKMKRRKEENLTISASALGFHNSLGGSSWVVGSGWG